MITITIPSNQNLRDDLSESILQDVCRRLFGTTAYQTQDDNRRDGRYIKIENTDTSKVHYVCFSNPNNDGRNSRLIQFVSPTYAKFYRDDSEHKFIHIYLLNPSRNDRTDYIKMFYRCFITIGINILNIDAAGVGTMVGFNSYEDLRAYREQTSGRNSHNRSTYFSDDDNQISIYGKTFGANAMESFILGLAIRKVTHKPVVFYPVTDNDSDSLSTEQRAILDDAGLRYSDDSIRLNDNRDRARAVPRSTSRNTAAFHYNLLQKFGNKQCYICGCDLERLIIGAHIERVADIDRSSSYTADQKAERAADGDNGLWLCANHDKMFEYGIIYFDEQYSLRITQRINANQQRCFIEKSIFDARTIYFDHSQGERALAIKVEHRSPQMLGYIRLHMARVASG